MKRGFFKGPAWGAPGRVEVDDYWFLQRLCFLQDLLGIGLPGDARSSHCPGGSKERGENEAGDPDSGLEPGEGSEARLILINPSEMQSRCQGDRNKQDSSPWLRQEGPYEVRGHPDQHPAHEPSYPDHPATGSREPFHLPRED